MTASICATALLATLDKKVLSPKSGKPSNATTEGATKIGNQLTTRHLMGQQQSRTVVSGKVSK